jgi:Rad3-related DNA helicase
MWYAVPARPLPEDGVAARANSHSCEHTLIHVNYINYITGGTLSPLDLYPKIHSRKQSLQSRQLINYHHNCTHYITGGTLSPLDLYPKILAFEPLSFLRTLRLLSFTPSLRRYVVPARPLPEDLGV